MINRFLIRTRIVQIVYSYYQNSNRDLRIVEKELLFGLRKSYDLYFYFLQLLIEVADCYEKRVESKRNKFLPTDEDLNPQMQLLDNKFITQLRNNTQFVKYTNEHPMTWENHSSFVKDILNEVLESEFYTEYINAEIHDYASDKILCRNILKKIAFAKEELDDILEEESIYWNDDVEVVKTFVLKTINKFSLDNGDTQPLMPMFKDEEDKEYALKLLHETILNENKYKEIIDKHSRNWDFERLAFIDTIIMQIALAEITSFPSIPVNVTLNEYIDIAKAYSTAKSGTFINGILDSIVAELRNEKKIFKN